MKISRISEVCSAGRVDEFPATNFAEFAFWGRSNVGKSSLLNELVGNKTVAKVSKNPGKTRRVHFFEVDTTDNFVFTLVDMPGYGYAKVSKDKRAVWEQLMADYLIERAQLRTLFLLIDASIPVQKSDMEMIQKLRLSSIPFTLVFTKTDKSKPKKVAQTVQEISGIAGVKTFQTSTVQKSGVAQIRQWIRDELQSI